MHAVAARRRLDFGRSVPFGRWRRGDGCTDTLRLVGMEWNGGAILIRGFLLRRTDIDELHVRSADIDEEERGGNISTFSFFAW